MTNYLYPFLLMLSLWQCSNIEFDDFRINAQPGETFTLELGKQVNITGEDGKTLTLYLNSVTDSRCPANAICMWLGNATVVLKATNNAEKDKQVNLCIGDCRPDPVRSKHIQEIEVGGTTYIITLKEVLPYPSLEHEGEAKQIRLQVQYP